jgi:ABC-type lipoprotein export system ATPase subunit/gamma-glutamylcyclotransferase (GGCT)/AIG2-like uncharacterized protein YtfP
MPTPTSTWNQRGSAWHRWDPHIHTPGTINNDQFNGDWDGFIKAVETSDPVVTALGVTDYYSLESYREVRRRKSAGALANIEFLFPNVEIRLDVRTAKGKAINLHLLFSPENPNHEAEIERVFSILTFDYKGTPYQCTTAGLTALGRKFDPKHTSEVAAYREGAKQFKVTYTALRELFRRDTWLRENCLIAVAAGQTDGTSGLQGDDSFTATREEIQRLSHIVFSGKPSDRDYWLGRKDSETKETVERKYSNLKPCLHGCDAHSVAEVGKPDENRYCWIKGDLAFETLRQAVIEPEERVCIGEEPPSAPAPSVTLDTIRPIAMPWLKDAAILLNGGLVAVIGARGSGKTALVDLIAAGAGALDNPLSESSFLRRATSPTNLLPGAKVEESWGDGHTVPADFAPPSPFDFIEDLPGVCYLSQQFVDRLCSSGGLAVELRQQIERVIFDQTEKTNRFDTTSFAALSEVLVEPIRHRRTQHAATISSLANKIAAEQKLIDQFESLKEGHKKIQEALTKQNDDLLKLLPKGKEERTKRLLELESACTAAESKIESLNKRLGSLENLRDEAEIEVTQQEPARFADLKERFADTALTDAEWASFRQKFVGNVANVVANAKTEANAVLKRLQEGDPKNPVDPKTAPLAAWPLNTLKTERDAVKKEVGVDAELQKKYDILKKAIGDNDTALKKSHTNIKNAEGADTRRKVLVQSRRDTYRDLITTFVEEQAVLASLYAPLHKQLEGATGALARLRFGVKRVVNLDKWVKQGEALLDLRKSSAFQGHGTLAEEAKKTLLPAWKSGNAEAVATAMHEFVNGHWKEMVKAIPSTSQGLGVAEWRRKLGDWLCSSAHLSIEYGLEYDGTNVEQLSPGTRGIVLLLLYLAIDRHDRRPLLIDQPEENLDPRSVFLDLVPHFREARHRRQVVIVTHNANLVVNTDADQVIVATSEPGAAGSLPAITYKSGSLENPQIRRAVCDILEGGERAFLERERRYRLQWEQMLEDAPPVPPVVKPAGKVHFGYGSNLGKAQMNGRCPDHKEIGRATLTGYRWIINQRGFANIVVSAGDAVEGFLYELATSDETRLDTAEGVARGCYAKHQLDVKAGEKIISALVYIDPIVEQGNATDEYARRINLGVVDAGLPPDYVEKYIRKFIKAPTQP